MSLRDALPAPPPTPAFAVTEVADAVANVRCEVESNLLGVLVAVIARYQEEFIAAHRDELAPLKRWLDMVQLRAAPAGRGARMSRASARAGAPRARVPCGG